MRDEGADAAVGLDRGDSPETGDRLVPAGLQVEADARCLDDLRAQQRPEVRIGGQFDAEPLGDFSVELVTALPAIPTPSPFPRGSPGLIVFERTPLEYVKDDIEKYAVYLCSLGSRLIVAFVDDCAYSMTPYGCVTSWQACLPLQIDALSQRWWSSIGSARTMGMCRTISPKR